MPGTQSKVSLFLAALKTQLAASGGWYTRKVVRIVAFEDRFLDASVTEESICFLVPGSIRPTVSTFGGGQATIHAEVRVDLMLARRFEAGDDPYSPPTPDRWEEQDRITQDATQMLLGDRSVGGTALNLQITEAAHAPEETFHDTYAIAFLSVLGLVEYTVAAP